MSTQGTGEIVGLGLGLCAAPLLAAAGVGILVGKGIMWCGGQLEKHYEAQIQKYVELRDAAHQYSLSQRQQMRSSFNTRMETLALTEIYLAEQRAEEARGQNELQQAALRRAIEQARAVLTDISQSMPSAQEIEREALMLRLTIALDTYRDRLHPSIIASAERARSGSLADLRRANEMLEEEILRMEDTQARQERLRRQAQRTLRVIRTQLDALDETLREAESTSHFLGQRRTLETLLEAAQTELDTNFESAQPLIEEAQRVSQEFADEVSTFLFDAWTSIRSQVNQQLGTLNALKGMLEDAQVIEMAPSALLDELTQRITSASTEVESLGQSSSLRVTQRLSLLTTRINLLKEDVFAVVEKYQQRTIADTIATTLTQLGFESVSGEQLEAHTYGDIMSITAMRSAQTQDGMRDDKLVTFEVSRRGNIDYDFSGYADESCVEEAERIFEALRASGIYLLDKQQTDALQNAYPEGVPAHILNRSQYQLHPQANKLQMELAQRLHAVLEQMTYTHIHESSVGGCIELDAFNGTLGYRVVLSPEGTVQVFKDAEQLDVSIDASDRIVAEAQHVIAAKAEQEEQEQLAEQEEQEHQEKQASRRQHIHRERRRLLES